MISNNQENMSKFKGVLYLADSFEFGEYNPDVHKRLLLDVVSLEQPDMIVFSHNFYGWNPAPRLAVSLDVAHFLEVVAEEEGALVVPTCNYKLRRALMSNNRIGNSHLREKPAGVVIFW